MRTSRGVLTGVVALASIGLLPAPAAQAAVPSASQSALAVDEALRGTYTPVSPQRILDTRTGNGAPRGLVPAGGTVRLQVAGRGGVPASGASAVVLNVTVVDTAGSGHLTVYPTGVARPTASSLNFPKGGLRSNSVTVQVGTSGQVDIYTNSGTHVIADINGWYASGEATSGAVGGQVYPIEPWRIFDTRSDWGEPLYGGSYVTLQVRFTDPAFTSSIRAFIVNVTAVNPRTRGYLTAWNGADAVPSTSTVNFFAGTVTPNFAVVPTSPCYDCDGEFYGAPQIGIQSSTDSHVLVDVVGFVHDGSVSEDLRFEPRAPQRIVDSRLGQGVPGRLGAGTTRTVVPSADIVTAETYALALNVTGVAPSAGTYLSVFPENPRPTASTLNLAAGQTAANAALTLLGGADWDRFNIYNNGGSVDVVVDVVGTYYYRPVTESAADAKSLRSGDRLKDLSPQRNVSRANPGS